MNVSDSKLFNRIHTLNVRQLDSALSDSEHQELQLLLLENPEARRIYVQYHQESACLRWLCLEELTVPSEMSFARTPHPALGRKQWIRSAKHAIPIAIACSILVMGLFNLIPRNTHLDVAANSHYRSAEVSAPGQQVATVTSLDSALWKSDQIGIPLLSRCQIGQRWQLDEGRAELTFDAGALVTIFAPADFDIISPTSIRCRRGRVTALVDERGRGFTIETPQATVVDLGTQFGLDISDDGETQVVVFQGSVDITTPEGGQSRRMEQGDALLLKESGVMQRLVSIRRDMYLASTGTEPLITKVSDNIRRNQSAKAYQIVYSGLKEDALSFVDRNHQWNGVDDKGMPEFLLGADYVMPFNDDKHITSLELTVEISRPAMLFVFLDNNMEVPEWLREEFQDTGANIGLDGAKTEWTPKNSLSVGAGKSIDSMFSIWQKPIREAGIVKLGGLKPPDLKDRPFGFNMYGIAAVELERAEHSTTP